MTCTVIEHVLSRLADLGIADVFGVPGDYSFAISDAVCTSTRQRWVGCSNELNAAYAADGYARIKGMAAVCTTYGVGELSALNGIAGAYAEHLPVFHLVGTPNLKVQNARALMHHTLGDGEYGLFRRMAEPVVCAHAVITAQNVVYETERLIAEALYHRRPVYMAFPADQANLPVVDKLAPFAKASSLDASLTRAAEAILEALANATKACVLPGILVSRVGATDALKSFVDNSGLPFATMFMAKSVLDEQHPGYVGMYDGNLMNPKVRDFVEQAELVIDVGSPFTDFNSGAFTSHLEPSRLISIEHHRVKVGAQEFPNVELADILAELAERVEKRPWPSIANESMSPVQSLPEDSPITAERLYPRWADFIREGDLVVAETGTVSMGLGFGRLPGGATFYNQTLWGSIGWATPAALGVSVAAPDRRMVLFTGEGSHQLTVQELGQFGRLGLRPVIFVLNNNGYLIERLLCKDPDIAYNDIAQWKYTELPHAMGCEGWYSAKVTTCQELDDALAKANVCDTGVYIEVVTDTYASSELALHLSEALKAMRKSE